MTDFKSAYVAGWKKETAFGNGYAVLPSTETACYKFGDYDQNIAPFNYQIKMDQKKFYKYSSYDWEALSSGQLIIEWATHFYLMDAIPLYFALGKTVDDIEGAVKTHALTGMTKSNTQPSFVAHYEATDISASSNFYKDFFGCRVDKMTLQSSIGKPVEVLLHGYGMDLADGNHITAAPALKPTAVDTMFHHDHLTPSWATADIVELKGWKLEYLNGLELKHTDGQIPVYRPKYLQRRDNKRLISFFLICNLASKTLIDEIRAQSQRAFTITYQRSSANDKITLSFTNAQIESAPLQIPPFNQENVYTLFGFAQTLSIAVRDNIATY